MANRIIICLSYVFHFTLGVSWRRRSCTWITWSWLWFSTIWSWRQLCVSFPLFCWVIHIGLDARGLLMQQNLLNLDCTGKKNIACATKTTFIGRGEWRGSRGRSGRRQLFKKVSIPFKSWPTQKLMLLILSLFMLTTTKWNWCKSVVTVSQIVSCLK